jgi:hypothetical protein
MRLYRYIIYVIAMTVCAACTSSKPLSTAFVAQRWGETMGAFDITGVFPPRGGVSVGDIYVMADSIDPKDSGQYKRRAILLGRLDLRDQMSHEMSNSLNLPPTAASNPTSSIFASPATVVDLASVGFGGLSMATVTDADLGVSVPIKIFRAVFGASTNSQVVLSVSLPRATHAEVGALDAFESLKYFCTHKKDGAPATKSRCSYDDDGFLTSAWSLLDDTDDPRKVIPKILLVTHVYYASEIDYSYSDQSGIAMAADVSLTSASVVQGATDAHTAVQADKTNTAPQNGASVPAVTAQSVSSVAAQTSTRAETMVEALGITGGTLKVVHADMNGADLKQVFAKPIAIGIRGLYITP